AAGKTLTIAFWPEAYCSSTTRAVCASTTGRAKSLMQIPRGVLAVLLLAVIATLSAGIGSAQETPVAAGQAIRINVARVNVGVVVTDEKGKFVEGLHKEAFHVFDNGTQQPITEFAPIEEPGQVLLLVE